MTGEPGTEHLVKPENQEPETSEPFKQISRKKFHEFDDEYVSVKASTTKRKLKGTLLASNRPSYCLKQGIRSLDSGQESIRSLHRKRLWWLLNKLTRQHNFMAATGVLSVLLQGTSKDPSPFQNRAKFSAALEVLSYIKNDIISSKDIQRIYELWTKKTGPLKNWSTKNRFAVQLELILSCLRCGSTENAYQASLCLMQERGFESDPLSNLVVGLAFSQLWYHGIPKELQLTELDPSGTSFQTEIPMDDIHISINNSMENDALEAEEANSVTPDDSNSSVANDKEAYDGGTQHEESMDIDENLRKETSPPAFPPEEVYMNSAGESGYSDHSVLNSFDLPYGSILYTRGLPPWLLPLKLPSSDENMEDVQVMHRNLLNDYYKSALKHLRVALYSKPPIMEAFHPLIQMLLLGDQVHEALNEVENSFNSSDVIHLRLRASLVEHFDRGNYAKLCTCFEDILKKDPTCSKSLASLVLMHQRGEYDIQNLVEMIALHLDATNGTSDTWKELASCFLKLCQDEEDRASTCYAGTGGREYLDSHNKIPELFTKDESGKTWRFRCKWWLTRHFHYKILLSDVALDDLQLLTHKAAAASHLYGRHFPYVVKATEHLEKENSIELFSFLQLHLLNSVGFYPIQRIT